MKSPQDMMNPLDHPKICKDCRHHRNLDGEDRCTESQDTKVDVVTGAHSTVCCYYMRGPSGRCGEVGALWVRRTLKPIGKRWWIPNGIEI